MEKGLLYYLNGNIQMGMESTRHMIEICDDERLRRSMLEDLHAYEKFEKEYYEYVASIENEFENSVLSVNFLSRAIKKLELQIDEFIGEFAS